MAGLPGGWVSRAFGGGSGTVRRSPGRGQGTSSTLRLTGAVKTSFMSRRFEILFVDPAVPDVDGILASLRMGVEVVVLDSAVRPARQIAAALAAHQELATVHVIAHGTPGRVSFAGGDWCLETLPEDADDLAAIGAALGANGDLRLWSCHTGAGAIGGAFIAALARATGAQISAATGFIGAAALGGVW